MAETNAAMVPVVENTEENELIDVLGRDQFVDNMVLVTEMLSAQKKNACYAINGSWGVGKSFVLDMFQKRIKRIQKNIEKGEPEERYLEKYIVFRYDCWKYDYYDEPLIAIVAAMLDEIKEQENLLPDNVKVSLKTGLRLAGKHFVNFGCEKFKDKYGFDLKEIAEAVRGEWNEEKAKELEKREFDSYFSFKDTLKELRQTIEKLGEERTVVVIVDELDRCLPEYTIKVLERLHHVFDDTPNVQVILAVDREQLNHTIKQIYGENTDSQKYLAKFIDFEMKLDMGQFHGEELEELNNYIYACGATSHYLKRDEIYRFFRRIFKNIDIRAKKIIIQKSKLLHDLLSQRDSIESDVQLCVEVFLMVVHYKGIDSKVTHSNFDMTSVFGKGLKSDDSLYDLNEKFQKGSGIYKYYMDYFTDDDGCSIYYINVCDIWGILLKVYRYILGFRDAVADCSENSGFSGELVQYAVQYWNLMEIIA